MGRWWAAVPLLRRAIKRAELGDDGVLRAVWWDANIALRGHSCALQSATAATVFLRQPLPHQIIPVLGPAKLTTTCDLTSGLWLEGHLTPQVGSASGYAGLWVELQAADDRSSSRTGSGAARGNKGFGFTASAPNASAGLVFVLGELDSPAAAAWAHPPLVIDRALPIPSAKGGNEGRGMAWRALLRTTFAGVTICELYVDNVLVLPYTLPTAATGVFAAVGNATVEAVYELALPKEA